MVTLLIVTLFKIGTFIPLYGVDLKLMSEIKLNAAFEMLNNIAGGALSRYSILALGLSPYITASIIMQVLQQGIVPKFQELSNQGEAGRKQLKRWTFGLSLIIGITQSVGLVFGLYRLSDLKLVQNPTIYTYAIMVATMTICSFGLALLAEVITKHGIGQGTSIIIAVGILTELPLAIYDYLKGKALGIWVVSISAIILLGIICYIFDRMTVEYRTYHTKTLGSLDVKSYLPMKVNIAGVVPTIFASAILVIPSILISTLTLDEAVVEGLISIVSVKTLAGILFYSALVMLFTFVYSHVQVNTDKMAEGLSRQNIYLDGIQPGLKTSKFLSESVNKVSVVASLFLLLIITVPLLLGLWLKLPTNISMMGTSLLILVTVGSETFKQIRGKLFVDRYTHVWQ